jgi:mxaC protein
MTPPTDLPFTWPWLLLALPLTLLLWWRRPQLTLRHSWAELVPRDRLSEVLEVLLRAAAVLAAMAVLLGMAGLYRPAYDVERVGQGAEIVLLLDRSLSMDQVFISSSVQKEAQGLSSLQSYNRARLESGRATKQQTARKLLGEFAAQRSKDRFAMLVFSTLPIRVLDFTQKPAAVQAAIAAGDVGRGLAETDIGLALLAGLSSFHDRAYSGSRIIMLVSDGGDRLDADTRAEVARQMRDNRVTLYWIYIRSINSPVLAEDDKSAVTTNDTAPEYFLHRFFQSLGTPYRAFEADNAEAMQRAMAEVNRMENLPITYHDTVPRRDLSPWCYGLALALVMLLLAAKAMELRSWR